VCLNIMSLLFQSTNINQYSSLTEMLTYHRRYHYHQFSQITDRVYLRASIPYKNLQDCNSEQYYYYSQYLGDATTLGTQELKRLTYKCQDGHSLYFDSWRYLTGIGLGHSDSEQITWYKPPSHPVWQHWGDISYFHRKNHSIQSLLNLVGDCDTPSITRLITSHLACGVDDDSACRQRLFLGLLLYMINCPVDDLDCDLMECFQQEVTLPLLRYRYSYLHKYLADIRIPLRVDGRRGDIKGYQHPVCQKHSWKSSISHPEDQKANGSNHSTDNSVALRSLHLRKEYLEEAVLKFLE